ncbi:MAG: SdpI family protein, partial [Candidatus Undinarchaeales archaeon]|nr:SdpI family protein [Candidatus Undinarchaeales archaeon]
SILAFMLYVFVLTTLPNFGFSINFNVLLMPAVGLLMVVIGYLIRFAKRNFFVGIRTPWTLASDSVWKKTHEVGSWVFIGIGVWLAVVGLILPVNLVVWGIMVPVLGMVVWMFVYSYLLYKKESEDFQKEPKL